MARKGMQKVRTGCHTCKVRKVKCDEAKPHCIRCASTGRKCDGYPLLPQSVYSWDELLRIRPIIPAVTSRHSSQESRALDFFRNAVAPAFSGYQDDYFWLSLVAQASLQEPAVRHAVVAISAIYEQAVAAEATERCTSQQQQHQAFIDSPAGRFALGHYSQALKQLTNTRDESVVLFVCILFVCIEILQGNQDTAIAHCRHGVAIFNNAQAKRPGWARDHLFPKLVSMSIVPFFFGNTPQNFPSLVDSDADESEPLTSLDACRSSLNLLVARGIRFIRTSDTCRYATIPETMRAEQRVLLTSLNRWLDNFTAFQKTTPPSPDAVTMHQMLRVKCLVSIIWVSTCLDPSSETVCDQHLASFREIVRLAGQVAAWEKRRPGCARPKFVFEMGFSPLLYFVVIKCRDLTTRLAALACMADLSAHRENLWDLVHMFSIGWRLIELEHGLELERAPQGAREFFAYADVAVPVPPDEMRVRDTWNSGGNEMRPGRDGRRVMHRKVCFIIRGQDAPVVGSKQWVQLRSPVSAEHLLKW
ncbi:hypothetical protein B0T22DRAFT_154998 [Podospora appendiculata]|uniref:Zn(2)-C6 fungal-type domain-containing protein n=1 Tax=Podospora appendiculata TaxID=314037 RepID=A0AAE0X9C5_9PEZI|nr:hypothetical protein B0T22DRAFT_154998 [Podospora appendiculata]